MRWWLLVSLLACMSTVTVRAEVSARLFPVLPDAVESTSAQASSSLPAVAFYYGGNPPWRELQAFDLVVVDPGHVPDPLQPKLPHTRLVAYVSVGEVQPSRSYAKDIPVGWLVGENKTWGSRLIDQAQPGWPRFFTDAVIAPLWAAGYRIFFLDTLDSYQLFAKTPEQRSAQEAGLVALVAEVKMRFPEAQLIFNRGFEILDRTHSQVMAVAAESLFQGHDAGKSAYRPVAEADREWLLGQFKRVRDEYKLPAIAIDYVPVAQRDLARETARRIEALGFIPWVTTPDLASLGVGLVEVMPRRILLIHSVGVDEYALRKNPVVRMATMPLNHLGYAAEYADPRGLPETDFADRYAGIVVWLGDRNLPEDMEKLAAWLDRRVKENVPVVVMGQMDILLNTPLGRALGVQVQSSSSASEPVSIVQQDAMLGFERRPYPQPGMLQGIRVAGGRSLLTLARADVRQVAVAVTPWGGYAMSPYMLVTLPHQTESRWVIDPFRFFSEALRLPPMPVPDVTTESGRRILMAHMDGDGFISRSELRGTPYAGELVRDRVARKYRLPMTLSVIEGEISPAGKYPQLSRRMESIARDIFQLPNVEIASHTYSHPYNWRKAAAAATAGDEESSENYNLGLEGYRFDMQREIEGSIRYIEERLAPPGKKVAMMLWSGDCIPGRDALEWTERMGVLNMNGGDTVATLSRPTLTQVEGLGVERRGLFQVFAPNQNENVYTKNWTGPYYGFERVIETFAFTEKPRRLKPMNLYFHAYLTTKGAGMQALDKVFAHAMAKESTPLFASEYAARVLEFPRMTVARTLAGGWRIRGGDRLRTLRVPLALGVPDSGRSRAVAGYRTIATAPDVEGRTYVHLAGSDAELFFHPLSTGPAPGVLLVSANARIEGMSRDGATTRWQLAGHVPLEFTLAHADRCQVRAEGRELRPLHSEGSLVHFRLNAHAARPLETICRE